MKQNTDKSLDQIKAETRNAVIAGIAKVSFVVAVTGVAMVFAPAISLYILFGGGLLSSIFAFTSYKEISKKHKKYKDVQESTREVNRSQAFLNIVEGKGGVQAAVSTDAQVTPNISPEFGRIIRGSEEDSPDEVARRLDFEDESVRQPPESTLKASRRSDPRPIILSAAEHTDSSNIYPPHLCRADPRVLIKNFLATASPSYSPITPTAREAMLGLLNDPTPIVDDPVSEEFVSSGCCVQ